MRLVVDANVFIAAFLKDAITRELLLDERLNLAAPEYGLLETHDILKQPAVFKRLRLSPADFEWLWSILTASVEVIAQVEYQSAVRQARKMISDPKDIPYLACALKFGTAIWSNDPDFDVPKIKERVTIFTTRELIGLLKR